MALNIPFRNAYYRFASSYSFLFFISWSLWWSLYAIWLKGHLGLTGTELGTLYSVNQFTSILFMMFYGIVQDKLGLKKPLIWCMSFILVLTGPFMIYVYEPLLQSNFSVDTVMACKFFPGPVSRIAGMPDTAPSGAVFFIPSAIFTPLPDYAVTHRTARLTSALHTPPVPACASSRRESPFLSCH